MTRLLRLIVAWSIRWFVVGGGSAGVTERLYAEAARGLSEGTLANSQALTEKFTDLVPAFERGVLVEREPATAA